VDVDAECEEVHGLVHMGASDEELKELLTMGFEEY